MIFNMIGGGSSSGGLNLEVVGGTTQPSAPAENTIWVNTDTAIGNFYLSAAAPDSPAEGDIWVMTGTKFAAAAAADIVQMKVCESPSTIISFVAVKQYISGAWVFKSDAFYDGTTWHNSTALLFSNGTFGGYTVSFAQLMTNHATAGGKMTRDSGTPTVTTHTVSGIERNDIKLSEDYYGNRKRYDMLVFWDVDLSEFTSMRFTPCNSYTLSSSPTVHYCITASVVDGNLDTFGPYEARNSAVRVLTSPCEELVSTAPTPYSSPTTVDIGDLTGTYHLAFLTGLYNGYTKNTNENYLYEVELKRG